MDVLCELGEVERPWETIKDNVNNLVFYDI